MTVGERIRYLRKKKGLSADKLGILIGKDRATIYRYESSYIEDMPTSVLNPLAEALGVTPATIMGWDEEPKDELAETLELLKNRPEMKILFDTAKTAKKGDVERAAKILEALKGE